MNGPSYPPCRGRAPYPYVAADRAVEECSLAGSARSSQLDEGPCNRTLAIRRHNHPEHKLKTNIVTDVVLHTGALPHIGNRIVWPQHTRRPIELAADIWLGPVEHADQVMDACVPRGENFPVPIRQYPSHYGFIRTAAPDPEDSFGFDRDLRLRTAIQLSRLARPTHIGTAYAARVFEASSERRIVPFMARGHGAVSYTSEGGETALWDEDVVVLQNLLAAFNVDRLPNRVLRALWYHEYIFGARYIEVRFPHLITALEALVHTDERRRSGTYKGSTDQFVHRLAKLASLVPGLLWTDAELANAYDYRSGLVHGRLPGEAAMQPVARAAYNALENGLRVVLTAAILHPNVADIFRSDSEIRTTLGFRCD